MHFPFSPGTTSDDRINHNYWQDICKLDAVVHTEKLDGENNCLSRLGVFARSHAAPTTSPWTKDLRERWQILRKDLGNYEIFLENLYAVHSIRYSDLPGHYFVFAIREFDKWLSWEETKFIATFFDFPVVPELNCENITADQKAFERNLLELTSHSSIFGSVDTLTTKPCSMEGIVTRNINEYGVQDFQRNVFKYVRKGHVKTDEHWTRNWKRAPLNYESTCGQ